MKYSHQNLKNKICIGTNTTKFDKCKFINFNKDLSASVVVVDAKYNV